MNKYLVSAVPCSDYEQQAVAMAMDAALSAIDGLEWVRSGMRVLIKANLVSALKPNRAATTHPLLVCELTKAINGARCASCDRR